MAGAMIFGTDAVGSPPTVYLPTETDGWFWNGNGTSIPGTDVPDYWVNKVGGEIEFAITQLSTALGSPQAIDMVVYQQLGALLVLLLNRATTFAAAHVVTGSRSFGSTYTNETGKPMFVSVVGLSQAEFTNLVLFVNGAQVFQFGQPATGAEMSVAGMVPAGATYEVTNNVGGITLQQWTETY